MYVLARGSCPLVVAMPRVSAWTLCRVFVVWQFLEYVQAVGEVWPVCVAMFGLFAHGAHAPLLPLFTNPPRTPSR
jgi:hypothetical protein